MPIRCSGIRVSAAKGLPQIALEPRFATEQVLAAIDSLAAHRAPEVRYQVALRLGTLGATAPKLAWELAERIARSDRSARGLGLCEDVLHGERRRSTPRATVLDNYYGVLITHHVWHGSEPGTRATRWLGRDAERTPERATHLLHALRPTLIAGAAGAEDDASSAIRTRGLDIMRLLLAATSSGLAQLREAHPVSLGDIWSDEDAARLRAWLQVVGGIADQLYFASGVFQARGDVSSSDPDDRHADLAQRERLYHEAQDLLRELTVVCEPHAMHHVIELLEGCIEFDPADVFALITQAVRSSAPWGYQLEPLAEALVVRIVKRYVTDHRELFQDGDELEQGLIQILDIFVEAGWPEARRLVYGLAEIFR